MEKHPKIPKPLLQGAKNRKDLAREYNMSDSTFYRKLKKNDIQLPPGLLLPKDYIIVYQTLGLPGLPPPPDEK